ncbi:hypothetical protein ACHAWO_003654 [Cyclotella atomus]|uniref:Oxidation resistance protein 1 n=1 Tax=Cyclotella atomus TaxID=382360 RepID=A0ABD3N955_9STRA
MAEVNPTPSPQRVTPTEMIQSNTISEFNTQTDTQRTRARQRWDLVKKVTNSSRGYKLGEGTSMSTAEARFLSMISKNMVHFDNVKYVEEVILPASPKSESRWSKKEESVVDGVLRKVAADMPLEENEKGRRGTGVFHVVKAAVAKERMRKSIAKRLSDLSGREVKFLTALVNSEDVTSAQLEHALDILDNDPMYNPALWEKDEEFAIAVHGEEEIETRRRKTLDRQFKLFDDNVSTRKLDCGAVLDVSRHGRSQNRRRSSVIEASVWKEIDNVLDQSTRSQVLKVGEADRSLEGVKENKENTSSLNIESPLEFTDSSSSHSTMHIKRLSSKAGEAIDPLLSAIPMEELAHAKQTGQKLPSTDCPEEADKKRSYSEELGNMLMQPFLCCGMDRVDINSDEKTIDVVEEDFGSLESKKRYLHLDIAGASKHDTDQLSTWLGAPEDYPILGLEKVDDQGNDPLDPHVLSPLLMKCLRDHLPYALKEENFWLKYSLVRDGASLDVIFKNLRHSRNTVLAIETTKGEVFGSFTGHAWRNNGNNYYGSCDAFVWNLRRRRDEDNCRSLDEYILRESTLDVYPWASKGGNRNVQLSNSKKLFVGGGEPDSEVLASVDRHREGINGKDCEEDGDKIEWGMALALDKDLLFGTSSRCATFGSTPLNGKETESQVFEIGNIEIWVRLVAFIL